MKIIVALAAWLLAALIVLICSSSLQLAQAADIGNKWPDPRYPERGMQGYLLPPECQQDLSWIDTPVRSMSLPAINWDRKGRTQWAGRWVNFSDGRREIWIWNGYNAADTVGAIEHERCHELMFRLGKNPHWHKE